MKKLLLKVVSNKPKKSEFVIFFQNIFRFRNYYNKLWTQKNIIFYIFGENK